MSTLGCSNKQLITPDLAFKADGRWIINDGPANC